MEVMTMFNAEDLFVIVWIGEETNYEELQWMLGKAHLNVLLQVRWKRFQQKSKNGDTVV